MRTYNIPPLIMLSAGAVYCLVALLNRVSLREMLLELLIVLIIFYVIGTIIRIVLDRSFPVMTDDEEAAEGENAEDGENLTVEEIENAEGESGESGEAVAGDQAGSAESDAEG